MKKTKLYDEIKYELSDRTRAILVGRYDHNINIELCNEHLDELGSLSHTYGLEVIAKVPCPVHKIDAATFLGKGKIEMLCAQSEELNTDIVIFDDEISPSQQRNLERLFHLPIIDRTELILEIFSQRAHTREAKLQIELAKNQYQLPRLKRLWTHLSRQGASGKGFLKGEGERQIELDKRMIRNRITYLKKEIEEVKNHRRVQRISRMRNGIPTFAIVGYTNVGKSTLLRALTAADVLIEDKLFATLDTTTRKFSLPNHQEILLADTVGFIRKIPHMLVMAFKSTLEELVYTDILLHLIDVNHPLAQEHAESTYAVLKELNVEKKPIITVLNKIDLVENQKIVTRFKLTYPRVVGISAVKKIGFEELMQVMMDVQKGLWKTIKLRIPQKEYALVSKLIKHGRLIEQKYEENDVLLIIEIPDMLECLAKRYVVNASTDT